MKFIFQLFKNLFAGLVGKLLFGVNFIICLMIFDWHKLFRYLETPARINCHLKSTGGAIDFSVYGLTGSSYSFGVIENVFYLIIFVFYFFFVGIFFILVYPSMAMTEIVLGVLKGMFSLWCVETFDILYIPIFAIFNSIYWIFLGDMIEMSHSAYLRNKPIQKPLSIFPDSDKIYLIPVHQEKF
jgi:hypothetical protein